MSRDVAAERRIRQKAWAATEKGREHHRRTEAAHRRNHPDRAAARKAVANAVVSGRLIRQPCFCGEPVTHAHHHRGYDFAHRFDVQWLCPAHHLEAHRA